MNIANDHLIHNARNVNKVLLLFMDQLINKLIDKDE